MTRVGVFKSKVTFLFLLFACLLFLSCMSNKAYASGETNKSLAFNKEVTAPASTSCTSIANQTPDSSLVNGVISYTNGSPCDRWTTWSKPAPDWFEINFGSPTAFNQVKLYIYNDSGGVRPPAAYVIQYWDEAKKNWAVVTDVSRFPDSPAPELNTVDFNLVQSNKLRVDFTRGAAAVGLTEIEVYLHTTPEDVTAASAVIAQIDQLPSQNAVVLTDQNLIEAARTAFNGLTATQQSLVSNTHKLTAAEITLSVIKALPSEDIVLKSAFGNAAGDTIILKLSTVVNATYGVRPDNFQIIVDSVTYPVYSADYDPTDSDQQTIILTLSQSILQHATSVVLSIQDGAFVTGNMKLNNTYSNIPILTFNNLDHNQDHFIGIDDVVQLIGDPKRQVDVNQDGVFDKFDIRSMLGQISMVSEH